MFHNGIVVSSEEMLQEIVVATYLDFVLSNNGIHFLVDTQHFFFLRHKTQSEKLKSSFRDTMILK